MMSVPVRSRAMMTKTEIFCEVFCWWLMPRKLCELTGQKEGQHEVSASVFRDHDGGATVSST